MKPKWVTALGVLLILIKIELDNSSWQDLDFERTWRWLFQKRVVCTNFDIYAFLFDKPEMDNSSCPVFYFDKAKTDNSSWCALDFDKTRKDNSSWCALDFDQVEMDNSSWRTLEFHEAQIDNSSWRAFDFDKEDYECSSLVVSLKYEPWSCLTWHVVRC